MQKILNLRRRLFFADIRAKKVKKIISSTIIKYDQALLEKKHMKAMSSESSYGKKRNIL